MNNAYRGRAQTEAKHFILKRYLQTLIYKLFASGYKHVAYVDGFSGPWGSKTDDFADTSFMIAIGVLKNAHYQFRQRDPERVTKCYFVEEKLKSFRKLKAAVAAFNRPTEGFEVHTFKGTFEDAVSEIVPFISGCFALTFIDPTGWTGYSYQRIAPILSHKPGEVLINFMYDHANRAAAMSDPMTVASFDPILGGPGWKHRLDPNLSPGRALEKLFRQELKKAGSFDYVLSTSIDKATSDRPHFFIAYGTRNTAGLKAFRQIEYDALRAHEKRRADAKIEKKAAKTGQTDMFGADHAAAEQNINELVDENKAAAKAWLPSRLSASNEGVRFDDLATEILEQFMLRETDAKDICVDLANDGVIEATWKADDPRKRKPQDHSLIKLK
jgi:three-Cys-motif partner protein